MMTRKELERLDLDHPEWKNLTPDELYTRYWMYFADQVSRARAEVHLRRVLKPITNWLETLSQAISKRL